MEFLHPGDKTLATLLENSEVVCHPAILGELACEDKSPGPYYASNPLQLITQVIGPGEIQILMQAAQ